MNAQNIWENPNSQVYGYLNRMAQKGLIQLNDLIKPINRVDIRFALNELSSKKEQLTPIEKIELNFYLQEYKPLNSYDSTIQIIKKYDIDLLLLDGKKILFNQIRIFKNVGYGKEIFRSEFVSKPGDTYQNSDYLIYLS